MAVSVGEITATLALKDQLSGALSKAMSNIEKAGSTLGGLSNTLTAVGSVLTTGLTLPMILVGKRAVGMASEYESAMTKIETLTENSRQQVDQWRDELIALGPDLATTPQQLAEGMLAVTSAGLSGTVALEALSDAAKASAIGLGEVDVVGRAVTSVVQAYGAENISAAEATAGLIATVLEGNVEADSLAGTLGRVVGIASQVGVSFQEVGTFIATFTRLGVRADEAVTSLRGTMNALLDPSKEAEETLAAAGTSMAAIRAQIREKGLTAALIDLVEKFGATDGVLNDIIPNVRALAGVLGTAGSQAEKFAEIQRNVTEMMQNARQTIDERFNRVLETMEGQWKKLAATLDAVWKIIGNNLLPLAATLLGWVNTAAGAVFKLAEAFDRLPGPVKQFAVGVAVAVAAIGPLVAAVAAVSLAFDFFGKSAIVAFGAKALGPITTFGTVLLKFLTPLLSMLPSVASLVKAVGAVFAALSSPVAIAVAAITALGAAVIYLTGTWDAIVEGFRVAWSAVKDFATVAGFLAKVLWDELVEAASALYDIVAGDLAQAWESAKAGLKALGDQFVQFGEVLLGDIKSGLSTILSLILDSLPPSFRALGEVVVEFGRKAARALGNAVDDLHEYAEAVREAAMESTKAEKDIEAFWNEMTKSRQIPSAPLELGEALERLSDGLGKLSVDAGMAKLKKDVADANAALAAMPVEHARALAQAIEANVFSTKELAAAFGLTETAVQLFEDRLKESIASAERFNTAAKNIADLVQPYEALSGEVAEAVKHFLALGASQEDLAIYFGISKGAVEALADEIGDLPAKIVKMDRALRTALANGANAEQIRQRFGKEIDGIVQDARLRGLEITKAIEEAFMAVTLDEFAKGQRDLMSKIAKEMADATKRELDRTNELYSEGLSNQVSALREAGNIRAKLSLNSFEYQKLLIIQEEVERIRSLDRTVANYDEQLAAIVSLTSARMEEARQEWDQKLSEMAASTDSWGNLVRGWLTEFPDILKQAFAGGGGLAGGIQGLLSSVGGDIGTKLFSNLAAKLNNSLVGLFGTKITEMLGTILPGIGGAIGALAGPLIQKIAGIFRKPEWKKLQNDIGRDWGVNISEGLAKQLEADSKKFGRQVASVLNAKAIFDEQGGISTENFTKAAEKIRDVFSFIETGQITIAQGAKVIGENWAALKDAGTDAFGFVNAQLRELIKLDREVGTSTKEVTAFIKEQAQVALEGFAATEAVFAKQFASWNELKERIDRATTAGRDHNDLLMQQAELAGQNRQLLEDLGVQAVASFAAALEGGMSFSEALKIAGPGLKSLREAFAALGIESDNTFLNMLTLQAEVHERNPQLIAGIQGLGASFVALSNTGMLNIDTFASMQRTGVAMYEKLKAAVEAVGGTSRDALLPMQLYLQQAKRASEELGVPLDEQTQSLIDQSKELGIWREAGKTANEKILDGLTKIVDKMDEFISRLTGIPRQVTTTVTTDFRTTGTPPEDWQINVGSNFGGRGGFVDPGDSSMFPNARFATGGMVGRGGIGTDTVPAMLTPGEIVLNKAQQREVADDLQSGVNVHIDARGAYFNRTTAAELARLLSEHLTNGGISQTRFRGAVKVRR